MSNGKPMGATGMSRHKVVGESGIVRCGEIPFQQCSGANEQTDENNHARCKSSPAEKRGFMKIDYTIISTGSKGNAVILNDTVLVDCGVPFKALAPFIAPLKIVLLTHIHGDHFKGTAIRKLAQERPALRFACGDWLVNNLLDMGVNPRNIDIMESTGAYQYPHFTIEPFSLIHDVPNFGYKVRFYDGGRVFYATDTGNLAGITAKNYDLYLVEGNYEEEEIVERIRDKEDEGQFVHEYRALKYHLSKTQCIEFFQKNAGPNSKFVYMHEHEEVTRREANQVQAVRSARNGE